MQKFSKLGIFLTASSSSAAVISVLAGVTQTTTSIEFSQFREAVALSLSSPFGFWFISFVLVFLIASVGLLTWHYNQSSSDNGVIFSNDGILLFDRQQHIAISIPTMKSILLALEHESQAGRAYDVLFETGATAGKKFGGTFKTIYAEQIEPETKRPWATLNDNEKLDAWEKYDATAGWGQINARKFARRSTVHVSVKHPSLFEGHGGEIFAWLLAGYAREVVAAVLQRSIGFQSESGIEVDDGIVRFQYFIN